jgi:transcriptional regulator with XRE-family HTH domain
MRGLTQRQFGELIGVTQRQAHKYERGVNSISAGRLYVIARELGRRSKPSLNAPNRARRNPSRLRVCCSISCVVLARFRTKSIRRRSPSSPAL